MKNLKEVFLCKKVFVSWVLSCLKNSNFDLRATESAKRNWRRGDQTIHINRASQCTWYGYLTFLIHIIETFRNVFSNWFDYDSYIPINSREELSTMKIGSCCCSVHPCRMSHEHLASWLQHEPLIHSLSNFSSFFHPFLFSFFALFNFYPFICTKSEQLKQVYTKSLSV